VTFGTASRTFSALLLLFAATHAEAIAADPSPQPPLQPLTTLKAVHSLPLAQAARGYPVHVHATITFYDPKLDSRQISSFLYDESGGVYAATPLGAKWTGLQPRAGAEVEVTGVTAPGDFAPIIQNANFNVLSYGALPQHAITATLSEIVSGVVDCRWVQVEGIVRAVTQTGPHIALELSLPDGSISALTVMRPNVDYKRLVDSRIRLRGTAAPIFNSRRQIAGAHIFFPSLDTVEILQPGPADAFALPTLPITDLLRYQANRTWLHRVHVRGFVTLDWPGRRICIRDDSGGICAGASQAQPVRIGSAVDLVGFVGLAGIAPSLSYAEFRTLPSSSTASPLPVTPEDILNGHDAEFISIRGKLLGSSAGAGDTNLVLSSGNSVFQAVLPAQPNILLPPVGSFVELRGVSYVPFDISRTLEGQGNAKGSQFSILLRTRDDIRVISRPSWWTSEHIFSCVAVLVVLLAGVGCWIVSLRRRVQIQTQELRKSRELYRHMAHHDALTGLPSRSLFHDRLNGSLDRARRFGSRMALLMLDLDQFKHINDCYGHQAGDTVLCATAQRISGYLRKTDTVARMGGDEFVILLSDLTAAGQAEAIASKLVAALSAPIALGATTVHVSASVGVCELTDADTDAETLMRRVDAAMYRAKASGRRCFQVFTSEMLEPNRDQMRLRNALPDALRRGEFELYYQPQVACQSRQLQGFEALLRWRHPELGLILPGRFIQLAEESGLIVRIGEWILDQGPRQIAGIEHSAVRDFVLSVNLSPLQFLDPGLPNAIEKLLATTSRAPHTLALEITESHLMNDSLETRELLDRLHGLGVRLVLDDFGVGFSTLSYITRYPLDCIKIDRSLVMDCTTNRSNRAVIRAILEMAHALEIEVTAEGVETSDQFGLLRDLGCDHVQGYYISHPLPAQDLPALIASFDQYRALHAPAISAASIFVPA